MNNYLTIDFTVNVSELGDLDHADEQASKDMFVTLLADKLSAYYNLDPANITITAGTYDKLMVTDIQDDDVTDIERPFIEEIEGLLFSSYEWIVAK